MFAQSFAIVAPIFSLVAIGFGTTRIGLIKRETGNALSEFVFVLAIPALLFRTVAGSEYPKIDPTGYWVSYFSSLAVCWIIAQLVARKTGRGAVESAVIGFASAQSNTVLIGIPLILRIYGEAGSVPIVLLLVVHLPVTMTIVSLLVARSAGGGSGASALNLIRSLVTHPILLAIFAGIIWRQAGLPIPSLLASILKFLGDAAAPCALIAMGMTLSSVSLRGSLALISLIAGLKLILHPVLVFLLTYYVFHLPPVFVGVAILFAACPTGVNAFLVADRYKAGEAVASGAIAVTTLLAIFSMTLAVGFLSSLN